MERIFLCIIDVIFNLNPLWWFFSFLLGLTSFLILVWKFFKHLKKRSRERKMGISSISDSKSKEITNEDIERIKKQLNNNNQYQTQFNQKTNNQIIIPLYERDGDNNKKELTKDKLLKDIIRQNNRLLILGSSGHGKTTLILEIALEKLKDKKDKTIPIILNVASWSTFKKENQKSQKKDKAILFKEWMISVLNSGYGFSNDYAKILIEQEKIYPIFDGFDELTSYEQERSSDKIRSSFMEAHDVFSKADMGFIVTSRIEEYRDVKKLILEITKIVEIAPLTIEYVKNTLKKEEKEKIGAKRLLKFIKEDEEGNKNLREVLKTPFYFNLAVQVLNKDNKPNIANFKDKKDFESFLIKTFVDERIEEIKHFSPDKVKDCLKFIAYVMHDNNSVSFELIDLQPRHLKRKIIYRLIYGLISGLIFGLIYGLISGPISGLIFGLISGLVFTEGEIVSHDKYHFDFSPLKKLSTWWLIFKMGLILGPISGLILGLIFGPISGLILGLILGLISGLILGLILGLISGGLFITIFITISISQFSEIKNPYYRLKFNILFDIYPYILLSILLFLFLDYHYNIMFLWEIISESVLFGALLGLVMTPIWQHFMLRIALFFEKDLPLRLVTFLEELTSSDLTSSESFNKQNILINQNKGTWRFQHRLFQEFFMTKDEYEKELAKRPANTSNAYANRGNAKRYFGQYQEAMVDYKKAVKLEPKDANTNGNYAGTLFVVGETEKAEKYWEIAFENCDKQRKKPLLLELYFYHYAHAKSEKVWQDAKKQAQKLLDEGVVSLNFNLCGNVQKAWDDNHPEKEQIKQMAQDISKLQCDDVK